MRRKWSRLKPLIYWFHLKPRRRSHFPWKGFLLGVVMTKDNRTACYSRISLPAKVGGQDISNQTVPIREYVQGKGLKLVKEYSDEGISGAT